MEATLAEQPQSGSRSDREAELSALVADLRNEVAKLRDEVASLRQQVGYPRNCGSQPQSPSLKEQLG